MLHKLKSNYGEIAKYFPELANKISSAAQNKQILLGMARKGEKKPKVKTPLGRAFQSYVKRRYEINAVFIDAISKIAPHWLGRSSLRKKQILLEMAKKGEAKPHRKTFLGASFVSYTHNTSNPYSSYDHEFMKDIKKIRPDWLIPRYIQIANKNKQILLDMAKKGKPRPHRNTYIGMTLTSYASKSLHSEFIKDIKKLRPDWFLAETVIQRKKKFLDMARKGGPKPNCRTVFSKYTAKNSVSYDPVFTEKIRKIRPDWLLPLHVQITNQKKQALLEMAKRGDPKPLQKKHPLGGAFSKYTTTISPQYVLFTENIRKIRPDWFIDKYKIADQKKQTLLKMARDGKPKPHRKTLLGGSFARFTYNYSSKPYDSYDPEFTKDIKKLRPDWFLNQLTQISDKKKQAIIKMAKEGKQKPHHNAPLGRAIGAYTQKSSSSYDLVFANKIRKIVPRWFEKCQISNKKKQILIEMAKDGKNKPNYKTSLGKSLADYAQKSSNCYDPIFTKQIKKLAPHWFKRCSIK